MAPRDESSETPKKRHPPLSGTDGSPIEILAELELQLAELRKLGGSAPPDMIAEIEFALATVKDELRTLGLLGT